MYYELSQHTQSELENLFLRDCITLGLRVEPQSPVGKIHCDFGIPEEKIAIEIDSKEWHSSPKALLEDSKRDVVYTKHGWRIFRLRSGHVYKYGEHFAEAIKFAKPDDEWQDIIARVSRMEGVDEGELQAAGQIKIRPEEVEILNRLVDRFPFITT
jgi:very-short-patch-repair endonuclease